MIMSEKDLYKQKARETEIELESNSKLKEILKEEMKKHFPELTLNSIGIEIDTVYFSQSLINSEGNLDTNENNKFFINFRYNFKFRFEMEEK